MKFIKTQLFMVILLLLISPVGHADAVMKIGIADFQLILRSSEPGKSVQDQINKKGQELQSEMAKIQKEFTEFQEKAKKEAPLLNDEQKKQIQQELATKVNAYRALENQKRKEFNAYRAKLMDEIKGEFVRITTELAKRKGYSMVIEKQSGTVLYAKDSFDLTNELVDDFNKDYATKGK